MEATSGPRVMTAMVHWGHSGCHSMLLALCTCSVRGGSTEQNIWHHTQLRACNTQLRCPQVLQAGTPTLPIARALPPSAPPPLALANPRLSPSRTPSARLPFPCLFRPEIPLSSSQRATFSPASHQTTWTSTPARSCPSAARCPPPPHPPRAPLLTNFSLTAPSQHARHS